MAEGDVWLRYEPGGLVHDRPNLKVGYEIWHVPLDWQVGRVEAYYQSDRVVRWRTLDHWMQDFRKGYTSRESAAQDLVANCPRTVDLIARRKARVATKAGELPAEGHAATSKVQGNGNEQRET